MDHLALDLGGTQSRLCRRAPDGSILEERTVYTHHLDITLARQPTSQVVVEACAEAFAVADQALRHGHEVRVVPSTLVKALGVGQRGIKTDKRDAQNLSRASCAMPLPAVHIPSRNARERKAMVAARESLVASRTALINSVRGWMRTRLLKIPTGATSSFPTRVRVATEATEDGLPVFIERILFVIDELNAQISQATEELEDVAKHDPCCQRLMSVPGVGAITAISFTAAIDDPARFTNAHAAESYLGLTPGEDSSGQRKRRTGITKAGAKRTRYLLVQAAWSLRRAQPHDPAARWALAVEERRGKKVAITALARKLAGILFALWRDGTTYNPLRAAETTT